MENYIVFFVLSAFILGLLYVIVKLTIRNRRVVAKYIQSELDKSLINLELSRMIEEKSIRELSESDGFVKFISQSRDWAFEYIEEVQASLSEFDKTVDPLLKWAMRFGILNGETAHTKILREISEAYDKLKSVLPENTETPNN
jgi:hypothetical protein